jgi:ethanolamine ammonia-lyase small subunit
VSRREDALGRGGGPLAALRRFTPARIGLGRAGASLTTAEVLALGLAHARARDAVHAPLDVEALLADLARVSAAVPERGSPAPEARAAPAPVPGLGAAQAPVVVRSAAPDRSTYLVRPDLGRRLGEGQAALLQAVTRAAGGCETAVLIAAGLSALAVQRHAAPLLAALRSRSPARWGAAPVVVALQGRVALGDEVGEALGARLVLVLVGERPGLSAADSLGAYLTFGPRPGRSNAERNCVSNVRPAGLSSAEAARRIDWLAAAALARGLTGVALKDGSGAAPGGGRLGPEREPGLPPAT